MGLLEERMRRPRHLRRLDRADAVGEVGNPACGDVVTMQARIEADRVVEAAFLSIGSAYQVAAADVLCDLVLGQTVHAALARTADDVLARLGTMPDRHRHLAHLAVEALRRALASPPPPARDAPAGLLPEAAGEVLLDLLASGPATAAQLEERAAAAGHVLPASAARLLASLRAQGRVSATLDVEAHAWVWRR